MADNTADGIEVDARGPGDVRVSMFASTVAGNGPFDPDDLDDGFDIDEYDEGSIIGTIFNSATNDNYEEGFDFNEHDAGDLRVDMYQVEASRNGEEGIDYEEDDDFAGGGELVMTRRHVVANGNGLADDGDAGLKIREKGVGSLWVDLDDIRTSENRIEGIEIREDATGDLYASVLHATTLANADHGINVEENGTGNLVASVADSTSSLNGGAGVRADQQTPGTGALLLTKVTLEGNAGGETAGSNVTVTQLP